MKTKITIEVPFFPTENRSKIIQCLENLIGEIPEIQEKEKNDHSIFIVDNIDIKTIESLFNYIRRAEILDSVRNCSLIDYNTRSVIFSLHKQALYTGKFAIVTPDTSSPLGNVNLMIQGKDPNQILDWFAPQTVDGKEIKPRRFNEIFNL